MKKSIEYKVGDKIRFFSWKGLYKQALLLSAFGYGVAVIGFSDMSENVLTITAVPGGEGVEDR